MTPDALRSLPPGAELDAVIAGLLGWKRDGRFWVNPDDEYFSAPYPWSTDNGNAADLVDAAERLGLDIAEAVSKAFALAVLAQQPKERA
jgi:hypothetical protein